MRKFKYRSPTATLALILSLCFASLFAIHACRKTDRSNSLTESDSFLRSKFFTIPQGTDPVVTAIAASVRRQDQQRDFIPGLTKKAGFALWDKAKTVIHNEGNRSAAGRETGLEQLILIPFAPANERQTKAILFVKLSATDTLYHLLYGAQYEQYGFDPANSSWNAKDIFHAFLLFDKEIFGHTKFRITDPRLLKDSAAAAGDSAFLEITRISFPINRGYYEETVCIDYTVCYRCLPFRGIATNSLADPCCFREDYTSCITYWFDDDDWGWYNPGGGDPGGGGGSGGGGGFENEEPCNDPNEPATGFCDPGWESLDPVDPCDAADRYSGATATAQYGAYLKPAVDQFDPFDPAITNQSEQYFVVNEVNGSNVPGPIQTLPTTGGAMQGINANTVMIVHTHPYGGFPSPSPADFFDLAGYGANFQMNYVIAYDGTKYAMVVNNYSQLQAFVAANPDAILPNGQFNSNTLIGTEWFIIVATLKDQGYTELDAYERATAYIMKKETGVTMVKANAGSDTFKKIGLQIKMENGTPVVNTYGDPLFDNADCL